MRRYVAKGVRGVEIEGRSTDIDLSLAPLVAYRKWLPAPACCTSIYSTTY